MTRPVSVVIPAEADPEVFREHLPPLLREFDRRDVHDEVIVVDDSGNNILREWFTVEFPRARGVVHSCSRGFDGAAAESPPGCCR